MMIKPGSTCRTFRRCDAFTLMEMMAAAAIAGFVLMAMVMSQRSVASTNKKITSLTQTASQLRFAGMRIRRDLENIYRGQADEEPCLTGTNIETGLNSAADLTFRTIRQTKIRPGKPECDVFEVQYFLRRHKDSNYLMQRVQPNPLRQEHLGGMLSMVAENIKNFNVRYCEGKGGEWFDEWPEDRERLPVQIEVVLTAISPTTGKEFFHSFMVDFPRRDGTNRIKVPDDKK